MEKEENKNVKKAVSYRFNQITAGPSQGEEITFYVMKIS